MQENYLIVEIESVLIQEFRCVKWDIKKLEKYSSSRFSDFPFKASLSELMRCKVKEQDL